MGKVERWEVCRQEDTLTDKKTDRVSGLCKTPGHTVRVDTRKLLLEPPSYSDYN